MNPNPNSKFSYIRNAAWKEADEADERRKGYNLLIDGHVFLRRRLNKDSINWGCKNKFCNATVTISDDNQAISYVVPHRSQVPHKPIIQEDTADMSPQPLVDAALRQIYHSTLTELVRTSKTYLEEYLRIDNSLQNISHAEQPDATQDDRLSDTTSIL